MEGLGAAPAPPETTRARRGPPGLECQEGHPPAGPRIPVLWCMLKLTRDEHVANRILMVLLVAGLWANAAATWVRPARADAADDLMASARVEQEEHMAKDVHAIAEDVSAIHMQIPMLAIQR